MLEVVFQRVLFKPPQFTERQPHKDDAIHIEIPDHVLDILDSLVVPCIRAGAGGPIRNRVLRQGRQRVTDALIHVPPYQSGAETEGIGHHQTALTFDDPYVFRIVQLAAYDHQSGSVVRMAAGLADILQQLTKQLVVPDRRHGCAGHRDGQHLSSGDGRSLTLAQLIEVSLAAPRCVVKRYRLPQLGIGYLNPEMVLHLLPENADLAAEPLHLRRFILSGKTEDLHKRRLHLAYPVIIKAAYVVAAIEDDHAIQEVVLTFERHVECVTGVGAIDVAEVGI